MAKVEKKYLNPLMVQLIRQGWWIRNMHGNLYQMGIPDLLLCRPSDGLLMLLEAKGTESKEDTYSQIEIIEKLKGPQVGNIVILNKLKAAVCILLGSPVGYFLVRAPFYPHQVVFAKTLENTIQALNSW